MICRYRMRLITKFRRMCRLWTPPQKISLKSGRLNTWHQRVVHEDVSAAAAMRSDATISVATCLLYRTGGGWQGCGRDDGASDVRRGCHSASCNCREPASSGCHSDGDVTADCDQLLRGQSRCRRPACWPAGQVLSDSSHVCYLRFDYFVWHQVAETHRCAARCLLTYFTYSLSLIFTSKQSTWSPRISGHTRLHCCFISRVAEKAL